MILWDTITDANCNCSIYLRCPPFSSEGTHKGQNNNIQCEHIWIITKIHVPNFPFYELFTLLLQMLQCDLVATTLHNMNMQFVTKSTCAWLFHSFYFPLFYYSAEMCSAGQDPMTKDNTILLWTKTWWNEIFKNY